jgi:hypothetical protein
MNYLSLSTQQRLQKRNSEIRILYQQLKAQKENGVQKYSEKAILIRVAMRYWLAVTTIENIIFYRNGYN